MMPTVSSATAARGRGARRALAESRSYAPVWCRRSYAPECRASVTMPGEPGGARGGVGCDSAGRAARRRPREALRPGRRRARSVPRPARRPGRRRPTCRRDAARRPSRRAGGVTALRAGGGSRRLLITPMSEEQAARVIVELRAAGRARARAGTGQTSRRRRAGRPLLSHALAETWEHHRGRRPLTVDGFRPRPAASAARWPDRRRRLYGSLDADDQNPGSVLRRLVLTPVEGRWWRRTR